jgi:hypothetical protein
MYSRVLTARPIIVSRRANLAKCRPSSTAVPVPSFRALLARLAQITDNGVPDDQVPRVAQVVKRISDDWRDLLVGTEGFLTKESRRGLSGRGVEWGEMVNNPEMNPFWKTTSNLMMSVGYYGTYHV